MSMPSVAALCLRYPLVRAAALAVAGLCLAASAVLAPAPSLCGDAAPRSRYEGVQLRALVCVFAE